jgi:4Fe-4S binding domain
MHLDIARNPLIRSALHSRWPQFILTLLALSGFLLAILSGFTGTPVGSRNFAIVFVWIAWWAILMLVAVPFLGRGWCSICPVPAPGEWLQRGSLLKPGAGLGLGLGKRWPNRLRNIWIQNGGFVLVALFSAVILTQPVLTAAILALFLCIAIIASLIFERRAFCRYLCPVGGFIGLYSQLAPIEIRVKDASICAGHPEKSCYTGNGKGYGCPWQVFPPGLVKNTYCGTCMECLRTCPYDNIAVQIRPFGTDLYQPRGRRLDESFKAFIMLGSALLYSLVLLGPWGSLKLAAYSLGSPSWFYYSIGFLLVVFVGLPGLFWLALAVGKRFSHSRIELRQSFIHFSTALIPLGLAAWIAFSLSFALANFAYVWAALSDPFGWGWDLFGSASLVWRPYLTGLLPWAQVSILLIGLAWSVLTIRRIAAERLTGWMALGQSLPVIGFCWGVTLTMMGILIA